MLARLLLACVSHHRGARGHSKAYSQRSTCSGQSKQTTVFFDGVQLPVDRGFDSRRMLLAYRPVGSVLSLGTAKKQYTKVYREVFFSKKAAVGRMRHKNIPSQTAMQKELCLKSDTAVSKSEPNARLQSCTRSALCPNRSRLQPLFLQKQPRHM